MSSVCHRRFAVLTAALIPLFSGCEGGDGSAPKDAGSPDSPPASAANTADETPTEVSASHILIMYKGSQRAPATVTRSREEAQSLAQEIAEKARVKDADFAALAKENSDGPTAPKGGNLGNFAPDQMVRPFGDAVVSLAIGEVSDPVETQFGFHVIRRQPLQVIRTASAKHILVMYQGSMRAPAGVTRSKEEAHTRIEECLQRYQEGEKFEDLAREYSDGPTGPNGGDLGEFPEGAMAPAFDEAVFTCEVGKSTGVVETPFGYHIIYRYK